MTIPIMYLPRSTPPSQAQSDPLNAYGNEEDRFIAVDIHSSNSAGAALEKLQTSAQVLVTLSLSIELAPTDAVPLKS